MTATTEFMTGGGTVIEPTITGDSSRYVLRILQRFVGASLAMAALFLWVAPGANWEGDLLLFKLILSITSVSAGLSLMHASAQLDDTLVEIDTVRREVRLIHAERGQAPLMLERISFADLGRVERDGPEVYLRTADDRLIAVVTLADKQVQASLITGLRDAGKLD